MFDTSVLSPVLAGRWDIYGPIHKGLRLAHGQMLTRLGRAAFAGDDTELLADLKAHLALCAEHLAHEERFIHGALQARAPGMVRNLDGQHGEHRDGLAQLAHGIFAVERSAGAERTALGRALYLAFAAYVAEDLTHMGHEETVVWPKLCELFGDDELAAMEMAIIASLRPEENIAFMRLMLPALSSPERLALLSGMKAGAPPEAFAAVIEHAARPTLAVQDFDDLRQHGLAA